MGHRRRGLHGTDGSEQAQLRPRSGLGDKAGGVDERLRGDASGVEAVAAHLVRLGQGDLGASLGGDQGGHEPGGPGADDDEVAVEPARPLPGARTHRRFTIRLITPLATRGRQASRTRETSTPGDSMPERLVRCSICVPAFTYTRVAGSIAAWLTA